MPHSYGENFCESWISWRSILIGQPKRACREGGADRLFLEAVSKRGGGKNKSPDPFLPLQNMASLFVDVEHRRDPKGPQVRDFKSLIPRRMSRFPFRFRSALIPMNRWR